MKLTTTLTGADAERLAQCISFAAKQRLHIGEHTQAGLNDSSGNVWLWDEDWPACVYTSIGFDTGLMWNCPNCGEEVDCETVAEAEQLNDTYNESEGCEACIAVV